MLRDFVLGLSGRAEPRELHSLSWHSVRHVARLRAWVVGTRRASGAPFVVLAQCTTCCETSCLGCRDAQSLGSSIRCPGTVYDMLRDFVLGLSGRAEPRELH